MAGVLVLCSARPPGAKWQGQRGGAGGWELSISLLHPGWPFVCLLGAAYSLFALHPPQESRTQIPACAHFQSAVPRDCPEGL